MSVDLKHPVKLSKAGAWRTYNGGKLIRELHGEKNAVDSSFPEEWILSTVRAINKGREDIVEGLSYTQDGGKSLLEIIEENPVSALGENHYKKYGAKTGVLLKLLDSAERLTIQVHPTRKKAMELFSSPFGKTECWHIIDTREIDGEKPCIYFGFKEGITREKWKDIFDRQDIEQMLDCLHKFEVEKGDTFLIEGGIPHAIGAGCFLIEVQEPTDYTIRTERVTPKGLSVADEACHQGLGFDKMFDCFEYCGYSAEETLKRWRIPKKGNTIIGYDSTDMFCLELIEVDGSYTVKSNGIFSGLYVLEGSGSVDGKAAPRASQYFVAADCEDFEITGNMKIIRFFGPKGENV